MKQKLSKTFRRWLGRLFDVRKPEDLSEEEVMRILRKMDINDPEKRKQNCIDRQFLRLIPILHKHEKAMRFLDIYAYPCKVYLDNLTKAARNLEMQRSLCKVQCSKSVGEYFPAYPSLLAHYLMLWDLASEVVADIYADPKCKNVVAQYETHRRFR